MPKIAEFYYTNAANKPTEVAFTTTTVGVLLAATSRGTNAVRGWAATGSAMIVSG
jgi:hypothetical protein